jgi:MFS family permease
MAAGRSRALPLVTGAAGALFGVFLLLFAVVPTIWLTVAMAGFAGIGLGGFLPPYTTLVSLVTPQRLRSQAFAWSTVFFALGAIVVSVTVGGVADSAGQRPALSLLALLILVGSAALASARRFVNVDLLETAASDLDRDRDRHGDGDGDVDAELVEQVLLVDAHV